MRALKLALALLCLMQPAWAGEVPPSPIAKTSLVIASDAAMAAVTFELPPHWHIYWQNPGDSGIAPTFDWSLPNGVKAGDILWPTPKRFAMGDIINYGYGDRVTLLVPLQDAGRARGKVTVTAEIGRAHV